MNTEPLSESEIEAAAMLESDNAFLEVRKRVCRETELAASKGQEDVELQIHDVRQLLHVLMVLESRTKSVTMADSLKRLNRDRRMRRVLVRYKKEPYSLDIGNGPAGVPIVVAGTVHIPQYQHLKCSVCGACNSAVGEVGTAFGTVCVCVKSECRDAITARDMACRPQLIQKQ